MKHVAAVCLAVLLAFGGCSRLYVVTRADYDRAMDPGADVEAIPALNKGRRTYLRATHMGQPLYGVGEDRVLLKVGDARRHMWGWGSGLTAFGVLQSAVALNNEAEGRGAGNTLPGLIIGGVHLAAGITLLVLGFVSDGPEWEGYDAGHEDPQPRF